MRLLHVASGTIYGGVETALVSMAKNRATCPDLEQHFAYCFPGRLENELRNAGASGFCVGPVRLSRHRTVTEGRRSFRALLQQNCYDAVICHSPWTMILFGPLVLSGKAKLIFWLHEIPLRQHSFFSILGLLERWAKRVHPQLVICNSRFTQSYVNDLYPGICSQVIYCPVDLSVPKSNCRDEIRRKFGANDSSTVIIQVSRLQPLKGHAIHIEALAKLKHIQGWQCWIVGGVQEKGEAQHLSKLKQLADEKGISERIHFLGQRNDVHQLLAAADIFCQPNIGPEAFGIVYIESLNAGLPVIATDFGGAQEIITAECGLLAPPGDADALAKMLETLVENVPLRRALGQHGANRARELCSPADRLNELFHAL